MYICTNVPRPFHSNLTKGMKASEEQLITFYILGGILSELIMLKIENYLFLFLNKCVNICCLFDSFWDVS